MIVFCTCCSKKNALATQEQYERSRSLSFDGEKIDFKSKSRAHEILLREKFEVIHPKKGIHLQTLIIRHPSFPFLEWGSEQDRLFYQILRTVQEKIQVPWFAYFDGGEWHILPIQSQHENEMIQRIFEKRVALPKEREKNQFAQQFVVPQYGATQPSETEVSLKRTRLTYKTKDVFIPQQPEDFNTSCEIVTPGEPMNLDGKQKEYWLVTKKDSFEFLTKDDSAEKLFSTYMTRLRQIICAFFEKDDEVHVWMEGNPDGTQANEPLFFRVVLCRRVRCSTDERVARISIPNQYPVDPLTQPQKEEILRKWAMLPHL